MLLPCLYVQGPNPAVHVYSMFEMQRLATIQLGYEFGYAALAFSADGERLAICGEEPDTQLVVYMWRKVESRWCMVHVHMIAIATPS